VHAGPVAGEQLLGVANQRVEVRLALLRRFAVGALGVGQWRHSVGHAGRLMDETVAVCRQQLPGHFTDIAALVGVARERQLASVAAGQLHIAQPGRQGEDVHLAAGVVDVELAGDVPAGECQQLAQAAAIGGAAAVTDVQGP